jgi:RNA polymerase primary sigma factor
VEASLTQAPTHHLAPHRDRPPPRRAAWPTLSTERERRLVSAAAGGDAGAREQFVQAFMPAIGTLARIYRNSPGVEHAELMQEGVVGLLRALGRYEARMNTPFWAYASWWVRQAMQSLVADLTRPVALSDRALRAMARVKRARQAHTQLHMREPSCAELAEATSLPLNQVEALLMLERVPRSLEEPFGGDSATGRTAADMLADPVSEDEYDRVVERTGANEIRRLIESLDEREREVLFEHYGVGRSPRTLRQIGSHFGLSAERVRQIEEQALGELRAALSGMGLERSPRPGRRCA